MVRSFQGDIVLAVLLHPDTPCYSLHCAIHSDHSENHIIPLIHLHNGCIENVRNVYCMKFLNLLIWLFIGIFNIR